MPDVFATRAANLSDRLQKVTDSLHAELIRRAPQDAADLLAKVPDDQVALALTKVSPSFALKILAALPEARRNGIMPCVPQANTEQWARDEAYPDDSVGRHMESPGAVFRTDDNVHSAVEQLREISKQTLITYGYVVDDDGALAGVFTMRDLLFAQPQQQLAEIMLRDPFTLDPEMPVLEALQQVLLRQYPVYPVCDRQRRLIGLVRGPDLFRAQTFEITAQAGRMVGIEKEERLTTVWWRSLLFRHPWLQINLLTAFVAAAVVGLFEDTINQIVALAVFLPVLAGQSGNTGCQTLAVTLRGMTLNELRVGEGRRLVSKEALLGLLNGVLVGITAGIGMYLYTSWQDNPQAILLGFVVFAAMSASCVISGLSGSLIPMALKRLGLDPATASSIFLTTATDVASMGIFLWLATVLLL